MVGNALFKRSGLSGFKLAVLGATVLATGGISKAWADGLQMSWSAATPEQALQTWADSQFHTFKQVSIHEKDVSSGQMLSGRGFLVSSLIEKSMEPLGPTQKAQVDLVIFKNQAGATVQIPRWLITRYPVALMNRDGKLQLVFPVSSKPRIKDEGVPLEHLAISDISEIKLSSYQQNYSSYYLKDRMDPLAMRGEKLFVQNCTSCHSGSGNTNSRAPASGTAHPEIKTSPTDVKLSSRDLRALASYLSAYRTENTVPATTASSSIK
jgi:mono/diheme cytochrome c family protein